MRKTTVLIGAQLVDGAGYDAPDGGRFEVGEFGDAEFVLTPPDHQIGFARVERAVNHRNVAVKNPELLPCGPAHAKQKRAGSASHEQLV